MEAKTITPGIIPRSGGDHLPPIGADERAGGPPIICPKLRAWVESGDLKVDDDGTVKFKDLQETIRRKGRASTVFAFLMARGFGPLGNDWRALAGNLKRQEFNVYELRGGIIDHWSDFGILRGNKIDEQRLNALLAFSKDGKTLSYEEFVKGIKTNAARDRNVEGASWFGANVDGVVRACAEFALLLSMSDDGSGRLDVAKLRALYAEGVDIEPNSDRSVLSLGGRLTMMLWNLAKATVASIAGSGRDELVGEPGLESTGFAKGLAESCPAQPWQATVGRQAAEAH